MRKLFNYQVIRYYPNINSDEFFNVGINLANDEKKILHFINIEHLTKIMTFPSIEKKNVTAFIQMLKKETNISNWYGNNLKFSDKKTFRSDKKFEEVLDILYEDYIGYKFHFKEKIDTIELIKQKTRDIIKEEFSSYIEVKENSIFDFDIIDKKAYQHHYSNLGSIGSRDNIQSMVWDVEDFIILNGSINSNFELLNINNSAHYTQVANNILHKSNILEVPYYDEDTRYAYIKQIANI